jgi:hypothetical protein
VDGAAAGVAVVSAATFGSPSWLFSPKSRAMGTRS